jgi:hypothetical protein
VGAGKLNTSADKRTAQIQKLRNVGDRKHPLYEVVILKIAFIIIKE